MTVIRSTPPYLPGNAPQQAGPAHISGQDAIPPKELKSDDERHPLDKIAQMMEGRISELLGTDIRLTLERNQEAGVFVYKAVDRVTGEVIRQYPSEEMLKLLSYFHRTEGLNVNSRA